MDNAIIICYLIDGGGGGGGGGGEGGGRTNYIGYPYSLKVKACPPRDQRPDLWSRVSGQT